MEFYTVSKEKRPVRLCEETRQFAWDSLHGRYGDESQQTPAVLMDDIPGFESYSPYARHDAAILRIAEPVSYTHLDVYKRQPSSSSR